MDDAKAAVEMLERIRELWIELGRAKLYSGQYRAIIQKISVLSTEYQALVDNARGE
jgi:hypothetical protein